MATVRSYTNLEQSLKLAEFLSHESADMMWEYDADKEAYWDKPTMIPIDDYIFVNDIPCWSLAALISEILPNKVTIENENYYLMLEKKAVKYRGPVSWDGQKSISSEGDNLIDACYKIIIKLHELNIL